MSEMRYFAIRDADTGEGCTIYVGAGCQDMEDELLYAIGQDDALAVIDDGWTTADGAGEAAKHRSRSERAMIDRIITSILIAE